MKDLPNPRTPYDVPPEHVFFFAAGLVMDPPLFLPELDPVLSAHRGRLLNEVFISNTYHRHCFDVLPFLFEDWILKFVPSPWTW